MAAGDHTPFLGAPPYTVLSNIRRLFFQGLTSIGLDTTVRTAHPSKNLIQCFLFLVWLRVRSHFFTYYSS